MTGKAPIYYVREPLAYMMRHPKYLAALAGALTFTWIYGLRILDPEYISWLMQGDPATHFLGWHFFRREEWTFPLGAIKSYHYPGGTSLVFTDSIPLLTIPLKLVSVFLPDIFQFHGIWLLTCYVLQGFFGALLFSRFTGNKAVIFLGSLFFLLNPVLVQRSGYHLALASHWLLLAGLYLYFGGFKKADKYKWAVLLSASALVNFYLLAMLLIIWSGYMVKTWLEERDHAGVLFFSAAALVSVLFSMWVAGYFVLGPGQAGSGGFGLYSMNLVSPFNPAPYGHFTFLKPSAVPFRQYEGFSYLGLGALALLGFALYAGLKGKMKINLVKFLPLLGASLILTLIAISYKVEFADTVLLTLKFPDIIMSFFNSIRASGRMFWPVMYLIILASVLVILSGYGPRKTALLISVTLIIQAIDFFPWYARVGETTVDARLVRSHLWENIFPLKSASWNKILNRAQQVIFVPPDRHTDEYIPFALLAANNGRSINVGYTARTDNKKRKAYRKRLLGEFARGNLSDDALYIIMDPSLVRGPYPSHTMGVLDGYLIIAPDMPIPDLKPWPHAFKEGGKNIISQVVEYYSKSNHIILISVRDDAAKNLPGGLKEFIKNKGGSVENLKYGGSYIAVINNGALVNELLSNHNKVVLTTSVGGYRINIASAGIYHGNISIIEINGMSLSPNKGGFNIVIINPETGKTLVYNYDTFRKNWDYKLPEREITINAKRS